MANMSPKKNPMPTQEPEVRARNFDEVATGYSEAAALDEAMRCLNCKHMPCVTGCPVNIHIPASVQATGATCELLYDDQSPAQAVKLEFKMKKGVYEIFQGKFSLAHPALYFYFL